MEAKKKRIAIVQPAMHIGGVEKVLITVLRAFDYSKVEIDLYLGNISGEFINSIPSEVNIIQIPEIPKCKDAIIRELCSLHFGQALYICVTHLILKSTIFSQNKKDKNTYKYLVKRISCSYDVAVSWHGGWDYYNKFAVWSLKAKRHLAWIHGDIGSQKNEKVFNEFDSIICVSESTRDQFCKYYPTVATKTKVIHNIIDRDEITKKAQESAEEMDIQRFSIVSVGRITREKGFQMIPDIAKMVNSGGVDFEWYIVGDGNMRMDIEKALQKYHLNCVHMLGLKSNPYPYMKMCSLYVQPSFSEGYCTTTNEAKVLGKPIVVADVPGISEQFVHGVTGYVVPEATVEDLAGGIMYMMKHPELRQLLSENLTSENRKQNVGDSLLNELLH